MACKAAQKALGRVPTAVPLLGDHSIPNSLKAICSGDGRGEGRRPQVTTRPPVRVERRILPVHKIFAGAAPAFERRGVNRPSASKKLVGVHNLLRRMASSDSFLWFDTRHAQQTRQAVRTDRHIPKFALSLNTGSTSKCGLALLGIGVTNKVLGPIFTYTREGKQLAEQLGILSCN